MVLILSSMLDQDNIVMITREMSDEFEFKIVATISRMVEMKINKNRTDRALQSFSIALCLLD